MHKAVSNPHANACHALALMGDTEPSAALTAAGAASPASPHFLKVVEFVKSLREQKVHQKQPALFVLLAQVALANPDDAAFSDELKRFKVVLSDPSKCNFTNDEARRAVDMVAKTLPADAGPAEIIKKMLPYLKENKIKMTSQTMADAMDYKETFRALFLPSYRALAGETNDREVRSRVIAIITKNGKEYFLKIAFGKKSIGAALYELLEVHSSLLTGFLEKSAAAERSRSGRSGSAIGNCLRLVFKMICCAGRTGSSAEAHPEHYGR